MKCATALIIFASLLHFCACAEVDKTCICPQNVMDEFDVNSPHHDKSQRPGILRCGKEINFITKNNLCASETIFRCRAGNQLAEILYKGDCGNWNKTLKDGTGTVIKQFCGRRSDACASDEDCWGEKLHRLCYYVDAHTPKKFYQLDDKGKLCCDQKIGGYINPPLSKAILRPPRKSKA